MIVKEGEELAGATRACWKGKSAPASSAGGREGLQIRPFSSEQQSMLPLLLMEMPSLLLLLSKLPQFLYTSLLKKQLFLLVLLQLDKLSQLLLMDRPLMLLDKLQLLLL